MSILKEIRELTGLSQKQLAEWLGVSKSLVQFAENGQRNLPKEASAKLIAMTLPLQDLKDAAKANRSTAAVAFTNPAKLALHHKRKMTFHRRSAHALQQQLDKLTLRHPKLRARLALFDAMKKVDTASYKATDRDNTWLELMEWFSQDRIPATGPEEQELLRDKIEVHLAYAEVHRARCEWFEGMEKQV